MSKILEAMKKSSGGQVKVQDRLNSIDRAKLFPPVHPGMVEEFENLANSLINLASGAHGAVVVFASTSKGEGASYVSFNCARYLTLLLDRKVAWVDANFRSPQKKIAGHPLNLRELLLDPESLPEFDRKPELVVIGNGDKPYNQMDLIKGDNYPRLLQKLRESFYFTIIDAPPILESVETGHLAKETMGLVLVVKSQGLKFEVINHGLETLKSQDIKILGTTLNRRNFALPNFIYRRF